MRLWSIHPRYLDVRGLTAVWREALLAQKVLSGATRGYKRHPQLVRFRSACDPRAAIAAYLTGVWQEAERRGYSFDGGKIAIVPGRVLIEETEGQLLYEWRHFKAKLRGRDPARLKGFGSIAVPDPHSMFRIVPGGPRDWERAR